MSLICEYMGAARTLGGSGIRENSDAAHVSTEFSRIPLPHYSPEFLGTRESIESRLTRPQEAIEERVDLLVRLRGRRVVRAIGHRQAVAKSQQAVDRAGMIERFPALGAIFAAARYQEWPRGHQCVQFVQVLSAL